MSRAKQTAMSPAKQTAMSGAKGKKSGRTRKLASRQIDTTRIMHLTLLALLPGLAMYTWHFGPGVLLNVITSVLTVVLFELAILTLRARPPGSVTDGSAVLTGVLLGLCLPPMLPFWMVIVGAGFAIVLGKHLYGGSGNNVFNPAMVGFAVLIVSFPLAMSHWPAPGASRDLPTLVSTVMVKADTGTPHDTFDGVTAATPLDAYKFRVASTNDEFFSGNVGAHQGLRMTQETNWRIWASINIAFLLGGLFLLYRKLIPWQIPVSFLTTLGFLSLLFYDSGSSASLGSPVFMLFSGATMLAAFFIATDPVTCPGYRPGLFVFGAGVALIVFVIRSWGAYPEGVAFAVLLMNACSPLIDHVFVMRDQPA